MATTTSITTTYAGEFKDKIIAAALLSGSTIENGGIEIKPSIKYKEVIKKLSTDAILKDATCDFSATSTVTLAERILQVEDFTKIFNQIDDLEDKIKSAKQTSSDWVDSLESAGGPLGDVGSAINKVKVSTQSFGSALKATGIGLIVGLLGGLAAAFSENESATKKLKPLLDGMSKIFQSSDCSVSS